MYDAIVVGAGHNGLVAAAYLARAGWKVLVLERRGIVGGACVTEEVFPQPGYRVSTAAYLVSLMQERVVRDLELRRYGYDVLPKDPAYFAPYLDGRHMFMYADQRRTCEELARFSKRDAERYPAYESFIEKAASFIEPMLLEAPPNVPPREPSDLAAVARLGWRLARRSPREIGDLVRMFSASARDILDDWFESDELKLALATDGVIGTNGGPSSPGTAYVLLHHVMGGVGGVRGLWGFLRGGMGALTQALAHSAQAHGADVRTGAEVARIDVRNGRAVGVVLANGDEYRSSRVISNADPRRTFFGLVGRDQLPTEFAAQLDAYRCEGSSFKINLALGELPSYTALPGTTLGPQHRGTTHICASLDALEHAWDDATVARAAARDHHTYGLRRVACAERKTHYVNLRAVRAVSAGVWRVGRPGSQRVRRSCDRPARAIRAEHSRGNRARARPFAARSRNRVWADGRQYFSRRLAPGSTVRATASGRLGTLRDADPRSVPVWLGDSPGWRRDWRTRP